MDSKNRLFIVIAVIVIIVGAMFTSFGRNLFILNTPEVILPSSSAQSGVSSGDPDGSDALFRPVEVTPDTVSGVVATLARPTSYYQELAVETFWAEGASSTQVQVWVDGGWSHSRQALPSGVIRHDLVGDGTLYYWYEGSRQFEIAPADERSFDLAQHIPTYETVVQLEPEQIADAGYEIYGETPCIYVEVAGEDGPTERYWVSVDSGLLVAAERREGDTLVYRMTTPVPLQSPCPADGEFSLPDGTLLHALEG